MFSIKQEFGESRLLILIVLWGSKIGESKPEVAKVDLLQVILQHQISELRLLHQEGAHDNSDATS